MNNTNLSVEENLFTTFTQLLKEPKSQKLLDLLKGELPEGCDYAGESLATYILDSKIFTDTLFALAFFNQPEAFEFFKKVKLENDGLAFYPQCVSLYGLFLEQYSGIDDSVLVQQIKFGVTPDTFPYDDFNFALPLSGFGELELNLRKVTFEMLRENVKFTNNQFTARLHSSVLLEDCGWGYTIGYEYRINCKEYADFLISEYEEIKLDADYAILVLENADDFEGLSEVS